MDGQASVVEREQNVFDDGQQKPICKFEFGGN